MRKIIGLLIITMMVLSSVIFTQAQAYNGNYYSYAEKSTTKSKLTPRKTRAAKKKEAGQIKEMAAAAKIDYSADEDFARMNPIVKPLKNNYYQTLNGQARELPPSKLKSNYYQNQENY